jgi:hypothetical protein
MSSSNPDLRRVSLFTDIDPSSKMVRQSVSLEVAADGLSIVLIQFDSSRLGSQQEYRVEIATSQLIDLIRTHGVDNQLIDSHGFTFKGIE